MCDRSLILAVMEGNDKYRIPIVNDPRTCIPLSTPKLGGKSSAEALHPSSGEVLAEKRRRAGCVPAGVLAALLADAPHRVRGKVSASLTGYGTGEADHRRDYTQRAAAVRGGKSKDRENWFRDTRRSGVCGTEATTLHETANLQRYHLLLQRLQHREKGDSRACKHDQLRASARAVHGQVVCDKTSRRVFRMDSGKIMTIARSRGVRQGGSMEPGMFCQALRLGIGQFKKEINGEGVAFEYMGIMPFGLSGVAANMFRTIAFHQRELLRDVIGIRCRNQPRQDRGICHRKGTSRRRIMVRSLLNIDVRIPRWRRKKDNGHWSPCRYSGKFLLEQEVAVDEDGSSGRLAHASVLCRTNKRRPSSPLNHSVRGNVTSKGLWTRGCPSKHAVG